MLQDASAVAGGGLLALTFTACPHFGQNREFGGKAASHQLQERASVAGAVSAGAASPQFAQNLELSGSLVSHLLQTTATSNSHFAGAVQ